MTSNIRRIGFGCVALSAQPREARALSCLKSAWDCGIRHFDTAPLYGQGYSEAILGRFLRSLSSSERLEARITSKFGLGHCGDIPLHPRWALPMNALRKKVVQLRQVALGRPEKKCGEVNADGLLMTPRLQPRMANVEKVKEQFEWTMRRLGLEQLAIYLGHELEPLGLNEEVLHFLSHLVDEGYVNRWGLGSSFELLKAKGETEIEGLSVLQYDGQYAGSAGLIDLEGDVLHIHHGVVSRSVTAGESVARKISNHLSSFPEARVLFSTTRPERVKENLSGLF